MMNKIKLICCCALFGLFILIPSVYAQEDKNTSMSNSYEELVQRNLDAREQLKEMEKKYEDIENERQVLILHIKKMQKEKELLLRELSKGQPQESKIIRELRSEIAEQRKKLDMLVKDRDKYKQGYNSFKNTYGSKDDNLKKALDKNAQLERQIKVLKGETKKCLNQMIMTKEDYEKKEKTLDDTIKKAVDEERVICKDKLNNKQEMVCAQEKQRFEKEKSKIEERVDKEIGIEKKILLQENEKLKQLLIDKEDKLDEAMAEVMEEKESFRRELREVLDKVTISEDQLQGLKNRAFVAETEASLLKDRLREQAHLRAKLENDIVSLRKDKIKVQEEADQFASEEIERERMAAKEKVEETKKQLEERATQLVAMEREKTEEKIKQIEFKASKELRTSLAFQKQMSEKKMKEFKEQTEKSLKKAVIVERKMSDERINQFKEKSKREKSNMHYNLAVVFDKTGNYENAEREYLKCLEIDPEDADVYYNLGILYDDKLNDNKKAVEYYEKYLDLMPAGEDSADIKRWMLNAEQEERLGPELK